MSDKAKGIISYIFGWIGGLIVLLAFKDNNKKTTIHACQAIVASVAVWAANVIYNFIPVSIPFFGTIVWAFNIMVLIVGIIKVVNNDAAEIPVLGDVTKSIFAKKIAEAPDEVNTTTTVEKTQTEEAKQAEDNK